LTGLSFKGFKINCSTLSTETVFVICNKMKDIEVEEKIRGEQEI
jgi:hypothetical protein